MDPKQFELTFEILPYLLLTTLIKSTDSLASNKSHLWDQKVTGLSKITVIILRVWKCKSTNKDCFSLKRIQINKQDSFNGIKNRKILKFGNSWKHNSRKYQPTKFNYIIENRKCDWMLSFFSRKIYKWVGSSTCTKF